MRLLDRLIRGDSVCLPWASPAAIDAILDRKMLSAVEAFEVSNIAEFWATHDEESWDYQADFPGCIPPFALTWIEYAQPRHFYSKAVGRSTNPNGALKVGILFSLDEMEKVRARLPSNLVGAEVLEGCRWVVSLTFFVEIIGGEIFGPFAFSLGCTAEGNLKLLAPSKRLMWALPLLPPKEQSNPSETLKRLLKQVSILGYPAALAISFLNCKNVKRVRVQNPPRLEKAYRKRNGVEMVRYYVLEIMALKETLRSVGKIQETGLKQALHICRGHFKDYSENGLFGKLKGRFWWPAHVQGTLAGGLVVKDYSVSRGGQ